ncbi:hypothetical protein AB0D47_26800 [Streptomyces sp. NPDC048376]|uniref:hypothetical protein n=1 Tax=Streptomyces sp. NPDC048376 TaxID=3154926 RepID=UPI003435DEB4
MARNENMIAALKRERALYVSQGDDARVAQVDESLKYYGYETDGPADGEGPQDRTARPQSTAEQSKPSVRKGTKKSTAVTPPAAPGDVPPAPPAG